MMALAAMIRRIACAIWSRRRRGRSRNASCAGFELHAPGCEFVRAAIKGELWNEFAIGIVSRFPARETWAGFQRACPLARSGARNTRKSYRPGCRWGVGSWARRSLVQRHHAQRRDKLAPLWSSSREFHLPSPPPLPGLWAASRSVLRRKPIVNKGVLRFSSIVIALVLGWRETLRIVVVTVAKRLTPISRPTLSAVIAFVMLVGVQSVAMGLVQSPA